MVSNYLLPVDVRKFQSTAFFSSSSSPSSFCTREVRFFYGDARAQKSDKEWRKKVASRLKLRPKPFQLVPLKDLKGHRLVGEREEGEGEEEEGGGRGGGEGRG